MDKHARDYASRVAEVVARSVGVSPAQAEEALRALDRGMAELRDGAPPSGRVPVYTGLTVTLHHAALFLPVNG